MVDIQSYLCPPEVVPLAEQQVALGVEGVADLAQPRVTTAALEAVLVPEQVQSLQQLRVRARQHNGYCSKCLKNMRFLMS